MVRVGCRYTLHWILNGTMSSWERWWKHTLRHPSEMNPHKCMRSSPSSPPPVPLQSLSNPVLFYPCPSPVTRTTITLAPSHGTIIVHHHCTITVHHPCEAMTTRDGEGNPPLHVILTQGRKEELVAAVVAANSEAHT